MESTSLLILALLVQFFYALLASAAAGDGSGGKGLALGFLLGPVGVVMALIHGRRSRRPERAGNLLMTTHRPA
jgi:hypothetical protein